MSWNIGIDISEHTRFQRFSFDTYPHFYQRVFTEGEIEYCQSQANPIKAFAGIFAAKEACVKACGLIQTCYLSKFEIKHRANGLPYIEDRDVEHMDLKPGEIILDTRQFEIRLSISHSPTYSVASAIVIPANSIPTT